jgi:Cof subfamily protein (haloacid dehalogenase superfamily)
VPDQPAVPGLLSGAGVAPGGRFARWRPARPCYVAADVDGTLLGTGPTASASVAAAAHRAQASGLAVGFVTGRLPAGIRTLEDQLAVSGPQVVHNGAQILAARRPIRSWVLPADSVRVLHSATRTLDLLLEVYTADDFVVNDATSSAGRRHWQMLQCEPSGLITEQVLAEPVIRMTVVSAGQARMATAFAAAAKRLGLSVTQSTAPAAPGLQFVDVTAAGVNKGVAVRHAADWVGCSLASVVAIGDGLNDLPLFAVAGTAIAMRHAPAVVRESAHLVVADVLADGAADALAAAVRWRSVIAS